MAGAPAVESSFPLCQMPTKRAFRNEQNHGDSFPLAAREREYSNTSSNTSSSSDSNSNSNNSNNNDDDDDEDDDNDDDDDDNDDDGEEEDDEDDDDGDDHRHPPGGGDPRRGGLVRDHGSRANLFGAYELAGFFAGWAVMLAALYHFCRCVYADFLGMGPQLVPGPPGPPGPKGDPGEKCPNCDDDNVFPLVAVSSPPVDLPPVADFPLAAIPSPAVPSPADDSDSDSSLPPPIPRRSPNRPPSGSVTNPPIA
ncbi:unnamed protein product [Clonostachys rhizophaga]|uniref:Uncharacterized protein n=1 Tax=Clonostachys rhizophaga TaxID=160324 RepID=A0A9N9YPF1_9HYPO|nr:unnamed protein product [Clonostachys rhizophaga]